MFRNVAIDMDGTLLDDKKQISKTNADAINRLSSIGVECIIVSGRHYHEIVEMLAKADIGGIRYIVCRDGQYVYKEGTIIHEGLMLTMNDIGRMLSISGAKKVFCSTKDTDYTIYRSLMRYLKAKRTIKQDDSMVYTPMILAKWRGVKVGKGIFFNGELNDRAKFEEMRKYFTVHFVNGREYDVFPIDVNKYAALKWLAKHEGLNLNDLVYLGDDYNDIECFENLPHCVVMGNGPESLKWYSMLKGVKTNNEDGVADTLMKLFG